MLHKILHACLSTFYVPFCNVDTKLINVICAAKKNMYTVCKMYIIQINLNSVNFIFLSAKMDTYHLKTIMNHGKMLSVVICHSVKRCETPICLELCNFYNSPVSFFSNGCFCTVPGSDMRGLFTSTDYTPITPYGACNAHYGQLCNMA